MPALCLTFYRWCMDMKYEVIKKERIFSEFFQVDRVELKHDNFRKGEQSRVQRYHLQRPEAAAIILENVTTEEIVMVEQFRYALTRKGRGQGWGLELIAGLVDEGETPLECALRETLEETGYKVKCLELITTYFASLGISDELVHLYYGQVETIDKIADGGGLAAENEDLAVREISCDLLTDKMRSGEINDAKTIIGIQWLMLNSQKREKRV